MPFWIEVPSLAPTTDIQTEKTKASVLPVYTELFEMEKQAFIAPNHDVRVSSFED